MLKRNSLGGSHDCIWKKYMIGYSGTSLIDVSKIWDSITNGPPELMNASLLSHTQLLLIMNLVGSLNEERYSPRLSSFAIFAYSLYGSTQSPT